MRHLRAGVFSAVTGVYENRADFVAVAFVRLGFEELVRAVKEGFGNIQNAVFDHGSVCERKFFIVLQDKAVARTERNLMSVFFEQPRPAQRIPIHRRAQFFGLGDEV